MGRIVVFGAGGRAGRAVVDEARARGHEVTAVVRDPRRHPGVRGDVTDPRSVAELVAGHDAAVQAATPVTGPHQVAGDWDRAFFTKAADALLASGVPRLVAVGLFADLRAPGGGLVMDDPALFPPELRAFAQAHADGLARLRASATGVDWVVLTPPAELFTGERTGRYRLGGEEAGGAALSYSDLAVAVVDEAVRPRHHRERVAARGAR
ncbi:NAD(P)-dependent oxidoreductase [Saccharothrix coeruleofusca]|uniref:NAD(P)-binding domain-containing protein n=1 Tax=Saccharothrix coeruleofusca TaxID=33919 RepID=A0A918AIP2_9PSEU|nr:NAD(P)H-binding protein [Saccharothrix coeruleofusca]MBP2340625.1 putative NADH-flavin reductase [Saccharothrix coeruleofusca]GGP34224.1 hypothetical protein GCM10010185_00940 [Saccharothrix coeruleofusca]